MLYRSALITGASSGIGRSLATCLAQAGTEVVLCARRVAELQAVAAQISGAGGRARVLPLDVADTEGSVASIRQVDKEIGGLDLVVACAGVGLGVDAKRMTWEQVRGPLQVNLNGAIATLCAVLPQLVERGHGHLVAISSLGALTPLPTVSAYCASKLGLAMFCDGLRLDLAGSGVHVTCVFPGPVRTPMVAHLKKELPFSVGSDEAAALILKRLRHAPAVIEFPLSLSLIMRTMAALPTALRHAAVRRFLRPA